LSKEQEQRGKRHVTPAQAEAGRQNLVQFNADGGNLRHGVRSLVAKGQIPEQIVGSAEATQRVDNLMLQITTDLGGEEQITGTQRAVFGSLRLALLVLELCGLYLAEHGLVDARGKANPLLTVAATYANSARLSALALGLRRVPKEIGDLDAVVRDVVARRPGTENADA